MICQLLLSFNIHVHCSESFLIRSSTDRYYPHTPVGLLCFERERLMDDTLGRALGAIQ